MLASVFLAAAAMSSANLVGAAAVPRADLPTVDLGYAVHIPTFNDTGNFYSFKNIRYGAAPVGDLRWKASIEPQTVDRTPTTGPSFDPLCPTAAPGWVLTATAAQLGLTPEQLGQLLLNNPKLTEDCLFLDVHVPVSVFNGAKPAAIMLWITGGGYVQGSKSDASYDPSGLLARSQERDGEGIIYVSINYRLGLFGWLNSDGNDDEILANAGLWDQRLAFAWVQKYIHLFGGDPKRLTVFGESAGGGSIMHHITAFGGTECKAPFAQAIPQSPAWSTAPNTPAAWADTLAAASKFSGTTVTTAKDLRALNSSVLMKTNQAVVFASPYGQFTFGPTVDGGLVPDLPGVLLLKDKFYHDVKLLIGHNLNESSTFIPPISTAEDLDARLTTVLYGVSEATREYILTELYPDVLDGTYGYTTEFSRAALLISELSFSCNTRYLATGFDNQTYSYRFQVPPGTHGLDIPWTFWSGTSAVVKPGLAVAMQRYFTSFAMTGNPNSGTSCVLPTWPIYGEDATLVTFGADGIGTMVDDMKNPRCEYFQTAEYIDEL